MGQEPAELRADIERRRDDLGGTIDAIGDRVSPGRIIERRRNRIAHSVRSVRDRVMGTVADGTRRMEDTVGSVRDQMSAETVKQQTAGSPLGAGLIAFGIGFIVAAAIPPSEPEVEAARRAQDHLEPAKEALVEAGRNVAADMKDEAVSSAQDVKAHAADAARQPEPGTDSRVEDWCGQSVDRDAELADRIDPDQGRDAYRRDDG